MVSPLSARKAEKALGDDVLLDLVGARVDGPGEGEQVAVHPLLTGELARGAEDVQRRLVGRDVPLRPETLLMEDSKPRLAPPVSLVTVFQVLSS